jgi:hypothetical protein
MARNPGLLKLQRQRKAQRSKAPKYFAKVRGGIDKSSVPEPMQPVFDYRGRGNTSYEMAARTEWFFKTPLREPQNSVERKSAIARRKAMGLEDESPMFIEIEPRGRFTRYQMFFNSTFDKVWFVKTKMNVVQTSIVYPSPEYAKEKYLTNEIRWYHPVVINSS